MLNEKNKESKKTIVSGKLYYKWINRNKKNNLNKNEDYENEDSEELAESSEENDGDDEENNFEFPTPEEIGNSEIEKYEIERKNLANRTSFPLSDNMKAWNALRSYRFFTIKNNKNVNIWEMWPLYTNSEAAGLVR